MDKLLDNLKTINCLFEKISKIGNSQQNKMLEMKIKTICITKLTPLN